MVQRVVILGAGAIGQAIKRIIQRPEIQLNLWDKDSSKVENQKALAEIIPSAEVIFLCIPSWTLAGALEEIRPYLSSSTILVGISKGLQEGTNLRTDQLIQQIYPEQTVAVLSGPMLAGDIQEGKLANAVIATANDTYALLAELFAGSILTVEPSRDLPSIAMAGILKNIYVLLLGLFDGLGYGPNVKGWLISQSVLEMQKIMSALKLDPTITLGTAGMADFIATGFSERSSNHQAGVEMAVNGHTNIRSEGQVSLESLAKLLGTDSQTLPLLNLIRQIHRDPTKASDSIIAWLNNK